MRVLDLCRGWEYKDGLFSQMDGLKGKGGNRMVNLPHDYMIETEVSPEAPAGAASGYFDGKVGSYMRFVDIPSEWEGEKVYLHADGIMMNASIEVNGYQVGRHHYGYTPVWVDLSEYLLYGRRNRLVIMTNTSMQPNSRWYTGGGIYREIELVHTPKLAAAPDGIYAYTKEIAETDGKLVAFIETEVQVTNAHAKDHIALVQVSLTPEKGEAPAVIRSARVAVEAQGVGTARIPLSLEAPLLWDAENPHLYSLTVTVTDLGVLGLTLIPENSPTCDSTSVLFGVRTITVDALRGMRINGKTVKMKGGCIHHDNGILGSVALYDAEYRKVKKMKESGFNMIRSAHNPPSAALLEACDRLGMYVFDEAFDAWAIGKQPGDYSQFFESDWKKDICAFMYRDRSHPSVVLWSTGNEIPERGGLGKGYALAAKLAAYMKSLDVSRPVTNGMCSFWSGLDDASVLDKMMKEEALVTSGAAIQNNSESTEDDYWEERTEPFVSMLDVVGYNYMEDHYEKDHERYPERVILGTESFPKEFDRVWAIVKKLPCVLGDCTWTAFDYIGEAGIGKSAYFGAQEALPEAGPYALMPDSSYFPWRLANDADYDINGGLLPQGVYRRIVWGDSSTGLFVQPPEHYGKTELLSPWGWPDVVSSWNWSGYEGKAIQLVVYSAGEEVELRVNGESVGRKAAGEKNRFTARFEVSYMPGKVEAISYKDGKELSRAELVTTGAPAEIRLSAEKMELHEDGLRANGKDLQYVELQVVDSEGRVVPDAAIPVSAIAEGAVTLAAFGSANPVTAENYTSGHFTVYRGKAMAILRAGFEAGSGVLTVSADGFESQVLKIEVSA